MNETLKYEGLDNWFEPWQIWKFYLTPIIVVFGLLGNVFSFMVFVFSYLRKLSISVYLSALAVSDAGFLITIGVVWLDGTSTTPLFDTDAKCQVLIFFTFVFSFLSVWFVVAFTSEIYFALFYPLLNDKLCRKKVALTTTYILVAIAISSYIAVFWSVQTFSYQGHQNCHFKDIGSIRRLSIADTVLTLLLPFTLLIVMNIRIFIDMSKFYGRGTDTRGPIRQSSSPANEPIVESKSSLSHRGSDSFPNCNSLEMTSMNEYSDVRAIGNIEPQYDNRSAGQANRVHRKTIQMLMVVAVVFLFLNLPSHIIRLQHSFRSMYQQGYKPTRSESYWLDIFNTLHWVNYAINFALYSACNRSFRQVFASGLWSFIARLIYVCHRVNIVWRRETQPLPPSNGLVSVPGADKVECHLSNIRFSQLALMDSGFILDSPPCLLANDHHK